ncbi:MAG: rubredoxin [Leptolyngbya sp. SIO4C1]|nr:rubredoxin [Leptolyngbya sp. SIO4C1]
MNSEPESKPVSDSTMPSDVADVGNAELSSEPAAPLTPAEMDQYECRACGYTYEPTKGDSQGNIAPGKPFEELPESWRCPVCGARKRQFSNIGPKGSPSGFKENLGYGLGVNTLTPGQKNILIFGALGLAVLFFLSLYGLR